MLGHEIKLDASVLFHAGADGTFDDGRGEPLSQGQRIAAQVTGQCDAQQQHDQNERQGGHDCDALQAG
jgi:hypothetical protein